MVRWLVHHWNDIKGNVKFFIVTFIGSGVVSLVVALTHGLAVWQQTVLALCFLLLFGWAIAATAAHRSTSAPAPVEQPPPSSPEMEAPAPQALPQPEPEPVLAPQLFIEFEPNESKRARLGEEFAFVNDGTQTFRNPKFGPLVWRIEFRREFELLNVIGPIRPGQRVTCAFLVVERHGPGSSSTSGGLPHVMRDFMQQYGGDVQPQIEVTYEDMDGRQFGRTFTLSIDPFDRVVWDPGPIRQLT
jgi:hypothetical protein